MNVRQVLVIKVLTLTLSLLCPRCSFSAEPVQGRVIRLAELEIYAAQLEPYKAALKDEIESSIRIEPGVLTLYAVAMKDNPASIRIFEVYADVAAYKAHVETAHFRKYKSITQNMVKSLKLVEADPILLGSKKE